MSHNLLLNANFHLLLLQIDQDFMRESQSKRCRFCSGPLHQAHYPRMVFGIPQSMRHFYEMRLGLCCGCCRRRTTPPSVRFLGARRFAAFVMVLVCAQRSYPSEKRLSSLFSRFGLVVSLSSWKRWRTWWTVQFPMTRIWREAKGLFVHQDAIQCFPRCLLRQFGRDGLVRFLKLISPLSVLI